MSNEIAGTEFVVRDAVAMDREGWNRLAENQPEATSADRWEWLEATAAVYRQRPVRLVAENAGAIVGTLGLLECRHRLFGNYLATAPYHSYGGLLSDSARARNALADRAGMIGAAAGLDYVLIRHRHAEPLRGGDWFDDPAYRTYRLDLSLGPDALWTNLRGKFRNQVRTSRKHPLSLRFGGREILPAFHASIRRAMHELGSPSHAQSLYEEIAERFGVDVEFALLEHADDGVIGGAMLLYNGGKADLLQAFFGTAWRRMCPGNFLYWSLIEHCCGKSISYLDMGRSLIDSGNQSFKLQMKPEASALHYQYRLIKATKTPSLNQSNPRLRLGVKAWRSAPSWLIDRLGPLFIHGLL